MSENTLFRKKSLDSISSPEQLNEYIKVSNPSVWLVISALFILLAAVLFWGFTGNLPTTISVKGEALNGNILCYVAAEDADKIEIGQTVTAEKGNLKLKGQVSGIGEIPMSAAEINSELGSDYLVSELVKTEYSVKITVSFNSSDLADGTLSDVKIVTESIRPIDFLLK